MSATRFAPAKATTEDYAVVFGNELGRKVLGDILREGFVYYVLPKGSVIEPHSSIYRDGARMLALRIAANVHEGEQGQPDAKQTHAHTPDNPREES